MRWDRPCTPFVPPASADAVIVGADASITPRSSPDFARFGPVHEIITMPRKASRPLRPWTGRVRDGRRRRRLILESAPCQEAQGPDVCGSGRYAATSEAHHMVIPARRRRVATTMRLTLRMRASRRRRWDYINAHANVDHGPAMPWRSRLFAWVLTSRADKLAANATKSLVGHTLAMDHSPVRCRPLTLTGDRFTRRSIRMHGFMPWRA